MDSHFNQTRSPFSMAECEFWGGLAPKGALTFRMIRRTLTDFRLMVYLNFHHSGLVPCLQVFSRLAIALVQRAGAENPQRERCGKRAKRIKILRTPTGVHNW